MKTYEFTYYPRGNPLEKQHGEVEADTKPMAMIVLLTDTRLKGMTINGVTEKK